MQRAWRLRGRVGESERSFFLSRGDLRCGAAEDNDIRLPVPGVSRHHARFLCGAAGLELEDLGSKNGTSVNGAPTVRSRLEAGDRVGLGPVELVVEPVHPRDLELAIALDEPPAPATSAGEKTTRTVARAGRARGSEGFFAAVLEATARRPEPAALVAALREALALRGAAAVELEGGRRVVLAASGEIDGERLRRLEPPPGAAPGPPGAARPTLDWRVEEDGAGGLCAAVGGRDEGRTLFLVLAGEVPAGPEVSAELRLCGGLLEVLLARREHGAGSEERPAGGPLPLPAGFVVGPSAAARELLAALAAIAPGDLPVLIRGETGVGKEQVARAVHALSPRRGGPFVALNCAALPADLLEAELFGIAAGVATGVRARHGRIREAHGGTLFLDEIGDMQAPLQARLLRV